MNCANGEISPRSVQNDHFYRKWTKTKNISQTVMYRRFWGVPSFDGIPSILMYEEGKTVASQLQNGKEKTKPQ
jgi:hypothetical protein